MFKRTQERRHRLSVASGFALFRECISVSENEKRRRGVVMRFSVDIEGRQFRSRNIESESERAR